MKKRSTILGLLCVLMMGCHDPVTPYIATINKAGNILQWYVDTFYVDPNGRTYFKGVWIVPVGECNCRDTVPRTEWRTNVANSTLVVERRKQSVAEQQVAIDHDYQAWGLTFTAAMWFVLFCILIGIAVGKHKQKERERNERNSHSNHY